MISPEYKALRAIIRNGPQTNKDLANALDVSPSRTAQIMADLKAKGRVAKKRIYQGEGSFLAYHATEDGRLAMADLCRELEAWIQ